MDILAFGRSLALAMGAMAALSGCVTPTAEFRPWMSPDVQTAWNSGYKGQGTTITIVDEFSTGALQGNLTASSEKRTHGGWTSLQAQMIAPESTVQQIDFNAAATRGYGLGSGLNIVNNSYSALGDASMTFANLPPLEASTIAHARAGTALVVKSAGNDARPIGSVVGGQKDILGIELIGAPSAIFVGALSSNGSTSSKANLDAYSNTPGSDAQTQANFLVVGVDSANTGLAGTSFAAPIVSGYAAILGSKFAGASPTQIAKQLLDTARTDTIQGYSPSLHGQGEASLSRALAPKSLQ